MNSIATLSRPDFLASVRTYLGTPYAHQGRTPGQRLDCLGVVLCALKEQGWQEQENSRAATLDYQMRATDDLLEQTLRLEGQEIALCDARPTDILIFRWPGQNFAQHCGVISRQIGGQIYFIHAYNSRTQRTVNEQALRDEWRKLLIGTYRLNCFA